MSIEVMLPETTYQDRSSDVKVYELTAKGKANFAWGIPISELEYGVDYKLKEILSYRATPEILDLAQHYHTPVAKVQEIVDKWNSLRASVLGKKGRRKQLNVARICSLAAMDSGRAYGLFSSI